MAKMVFDEYYGELSFAQRAAYRKHNVSPWDHSELVREFGEDSHAEITKAVKDRSVKFGTYRAPLPGERYWR